jgi:hypothetical protein
MGLWAYGRMGSPDITTRWSIGGKLKESAKASAVRRPRRSRTAYPRAGQITYCLSTSWFRASSASISCNENVARKSLRTSGRGREAAHSRSHRVNSIPQQANTWKARRLETCAQSTLEGLAVWARKLGRPQYEQSPTTISHEAAAPSTYTTGGEPCHGSTV